MSIQVVHRFYDPRQATEIRYQCGKCHGFIHVQVPWLVWQGIRDGVPHAWMRRQELVKEAMDEHRRVCPKGTADEYRVLEITYPRNKPN